MDLINPNFDNYKNEIIDALNEVMGGSFKRVIEEKINNVYRINYINHIELDNYLYTFKKYKQVELCIKFLKIIGKNLEQKQTKEENNKYIKEEINNYFDMFYVFDSSTILYYQGILSFKPLTEELQAKENVKEIETFKTKQQIKFLNSLIGEEKVTLENYEEFKTTIEYKKLIELVNEYLRIFDIIKEEYEEFENTLEEYNKYVENERKRKEELKEVYKQKFIEEVKQIENLPHIIKNTLDNTENLEIDIEYKTNFEYFSKEDEENLKDFNISDLDKGYIAFARLKTLKNLGLEIDIPIISKCLEFYNELIQKEEVKKLIPSYDLIRTIKEMREEKANELNKEFIYNSKSFKKYINMFSDENSKSYFYNEIKNKRIAVIQYNNETTRGSMLFFSILGVWYGKVDFVYLHELVHVIETCYVGDFDFNNFKRTVGFEFIDYENTHLNPYTKSKRKYERLNETITDIFALEARKILHSKGIYFAESKEIIDENVEDNNTSNIIKKLVSHLLDLARKEIIEARMTGNLEELYNFLGRENFENLNDVINKVDYLINQGLEEKIKKNDLNDTLIIQYNYELKRLEEIYLNINSRILESRKNITK